MSAGIVIHMAQRKILSERYLNFLGKKGQSVTGKRGIIELHHESIFRGFTGGRKKYNDYGAIPLTKGEHTDRHSFGLKWWDDIGLKPTEVVIRLLQEYRDTLSPFSFKNDLEYEAEVNVVSELLDEIQ